jgi:hypothetical protein
MDRTRRVDRCLSVAALAIGTVVLQQGLGAQNCPADLEWPATTTIAAGSVSGGTSIAAAGDAVAWPVSNLTKTLITERHALATTSIAEKPVAIPALGGTVCDPAFGTSITRVTAPGLGLYLTDTFSYGGNWIMTLSTSGGPVILGFDPATGKARLDSSGNPIQITVGAAMIPLSPSGNYCPINHAIWSRKDEGVLYIVACGTRIFKYNVAAYNAAKPMAGLMTGSNARSAAAWPAKCLNSSACRQGPVFMDFSDKFQNLSLDGATGALTLLLSENDDTFSAFLTRTQGYKNSQGVLAYRPWNDSLWIATGAAGNPDTPMLTSNWQGAPVNKRILGTNLDYTGRYLALYVCGDPATNLNSCGIGKAYVMDLNTVSPSTPLQQATPALVDGVSHGAWMGAMSAGYAGAVQVLQSQYFTGVPEIKNLRLPKLSLSGWWGNYSSVSARVNGPNGDQLAGVLSTYSFETQAGIPATINACPSRNCLYANELMMFNLTGTHFLRLGHTRSAIPDYSTVGAYWDLPRPSTSRDGKWVLFSSNWGKPSVGSQANQAIYSLRVPTAWKALMDDSVTLSPSDTAVTPGEYVSWTVGHAATGQGASLLVQDSNFTAAKKSSACYIKVSTGGLLSLANDTGQFNSTLSGVIGLGGALQNSQCQIDMANSKTIASTHGNTEYQLQVAFKKPWASKKLRVIALETGGSVWKDAGTVTVDAGAAAKWVPIPGLPPVQVLSDRVINPSATGFFALGQLASKITPGSYFEFRFNKGGVNNHSISFTPTLPTWNVIYQYLTTMYLYEDSTGRAEMTATQNSGAKVLTMVTRKNSSALIRMTFLPGKVQYTVDGVLVATADIPTSITDLYVVANMMSPQSALMNPVANIQ